MHFVITVIIVLAVIGYIRGSRKARWTSELKAAQKRVAKFERKLTKLSETK